MIYIRDFLADQKILVSPSVNPSPKVSITLPTFRRFKEGFLERAIQSVLAQTYQDFELLVIDDGSTDGSYDLIEQFRAKDPRVVHVRHEQNSGIHTIRLNEGIDLAKGKYIAFQFDDDSWRENALEMLVTEIERHPEPVFVHGKALYHTYLGQVVQPTQPVDIVTLLNQNCLPNNGVLFPRSLMETYGMYDPHIGMRRLCDWDLWLRLIQHVPFITLDEVLTDVYEGNTGAIGVTVPWDIDLFRYLNSIPRNALLTPARWRDYPIDSLQIGEVELAGDFRRRLYEEQIVPYYFKFRHAFPQVARFQASYQPPQRKNLLFTKQSYDTCNEVTLAHYDRLSNARGSFKSFFQILSEVRPDWPVEADQLLLVRTVEDEAVALSTQALEQGHPAGLYLDDDLFSFSEYGPKFDNLAPGSVYYENLSQIAQQVDGVLVTNDFIGQAVGKFTNRVIPHNNTIPDEALPAQPHARSAPRLRIGYAGGDYRIEEFRLLWDALQRIAAEYADRVEFEFWGLDVSALPRLAAPVSQRPFTFSYHQYLERLTKAGFDILLTPLLDHPRPRLGKSLIKYYETAAAGALGIFSDVPQYQALPGGLTCLKACNDVESWYQALKTAIEMEPAEFDRLRQRCLAHVREEFSASAQIDLHEAALRAVEFHARTRAKRYSDGRPRLLYVLHSAHFGGGELQIWRRLLLMKRYGIQPILVIPAALKDSENARRLKDVLALEGIPLESAAYTCFTEPRSPEEYTSDLERSDIRALLERTTPALVHSVIFNPSLGQVCQEMNIPHVSTEYAIEEDFAWGEPRPHFAYCQVVQSDTVRYTNRWAGLLEATKFCSRDMAPLELFQLGQRRHLEAIGQPPAPTGGPLRLVVTGTFQERKQQLEIIEAVGRLKKQGLDCRLTFYGYTHFFPEYMKKCQQAIQAWGLEERVSIQDFTHDLVPVLADADMLLSLSTFESFPGSIKDAMAAGVLVVATPVGGIPELMIDNVSGIVCAGTAVPDLVAGIQRALALAPEKRRQIVEQARRVAREELHPYRTANDVFQMYNLALELVAAGRPGQASQAPVAPVPAARLSKRARMVAPRHPPASLMPIGAGVRYQVTPEANQWNGIDVLVETNGRKSSGQLVLKIRSAGGDLLRVVTVDASRLYGTNWTDLRFASLRNAAGQAFQVELSTAGTQPGTLLSLHQSSPPYPRWVRMLFRLLRRAGLKLPGGQLHCRMWYGQE